MCNISKPFIYLENGKHNLQENRTLQTEEGVSFEI